MISPAFRQPARQAERRIVRQITGHVFAAIFGNDPKDEQLLICRVHREFTRLHHTLRKSGYGAGSWEHETRLAFLDFLADACKPYQVEGSAVRVCHTVNGLKPRFMEKFSGQYVTSYGGADEAALMLFLAVRELAADIGERYPEEDSSRLLRIAHALL